MSRWISDERIWNDDVVVVDGEEIEAFWRLPFLPGLWAVGGGDGGDCFDLLIGRVK